MAIVAFTGFETGGVLEHTNAGSGIVSVQSTTKRTGTYAMQVNDTVGTQTGTGVVQGHDATGVSVAFSMADSYVTFYFRYATKPGSGSEEIAVFLTGVSFKLSVRINSSGNLLAYDNGTTLLGTGSTVLSQDTWYRIEARCQPGTNGAWEVKIDGVSEISGTRTWTNAGNVGSLAFGKRVNRSSQTVNYFYDDICINDAAYPGVGEVRMAVPIGAGGASGWTNGTGTTFAEADDVPNDGDTTYIQASATEDNQNHTFDMQASATIGISGVIAAVKPMVYAKTASTSGTSAVRLRTESGGSGFELSPLELTTSYQLLATIYELDPLDSAAWTTTKFDTVCVGMAADTLAQTQRFTVAYLGVWITPDVGFLTTIASALDEISAALAANQSYLTTVDSDVDELTASLNVAMHPLITIASAVDELIASLNAQQQYLATVASSLDELTASLNLNQSYLVTIDSDVDELTASLEAAMHPQVTIAALVDEAIASLNVEQSTPISLTIASTVDEVTASLNAQQIDFVTIASLVDEVVASLNVNQVDLVTIGSTLDELTASLSVEQSIFATIASVLDETTASLNAEQRLLITIGASLDELVASLTLEQIVLITLAASMDEVTAALFLLAEIEGITPIAGLILRALDPDWSLFPHAGQDGTETLRALDPNRLLSPLEASDA